MAMPKYWDMGQNPFAAALQTGGSSPSRGATATMQDPMGASSGTPRMPTYNPIMASDGPLAQAGWIGALIAQGPSRQEVMLQRQGIAKGAFYKGLQTRIDSGMSPQKALMDLISSPDGMQYFLHAPQENLTEVAQYLKLVEGDTETQQRKQVYAEAGLPDPTAPDATADPQTTTLGRLMDPTPVDRQDLNPTRAVLPLAMKTTTLSERQHLALANKFAQAGLLDDAKFHQEMAKQAAEGIEHPLVEVIGADGKRRYMTREDAEGQLAPEPSSLVNIDQRQRGAQEELVGQALGEEFKTVFTSLGDTIAKAPLANQFRAALESEQFIPGAGADFRLWISRWADFLGADVDADALKKLGLGDPRAAEVMTSTANRLGLMQADNLSKMTNMSLEFIMQANPSIYMTPGGLHAILDMMDFEASRAKELRTLMMTFVAENGKDPCGPLTPCGKPTLWDEMETFLATKQEGDKAFFQEVFQKMHSGAGIDLPGLAGQAEEMLGGGQPKPQASFKTEKDAQAAEKAGTLKCGPDVIVEINGQLGKWECE